MLGMVTMTVALMGTGYAYWADSLAVAGTVTTGNMEMKFVQESAKVSAYRYVAEPKVTIRDKKVTYQLENLYPGASYGLNYKFTNTGTMATKIDEFKVTLNQNAENMQEHLIVSGELKKENQIIATISDVKLSELEDSLNKAIQMHQIDLDEEVEFRNFTVKMDEKVGNNEGKNEFENQKNIQIELDTIFTQWNNMDKSSGDGIVGEQTGIKYVYTRDKGADGGTVTTSGNYQVVVTGEDKAYETITIVDNDYFGTMKLERQQDNRYELVESSKLPDYEGISFSLNIQPAGPSNYAYMFQTMRQGKEIVIEVK